MITIKKLSLEEALVGLNAMLEEAKKDPQRPMAMVVVDESGAPICFYRMDGTNSDFTRRMAFRKANSAAQSGNNTRAFKNGIVPEGLTPGHFNDPDLCAVPGGVIIVPPDREQNEWKQGPLGPEVSVARGHVGATGTSGRNAHEDEAIAQIGARAIQKLIWPDGK